MKMFTRRLEDVDDAIGKADFLDILLYSINRNYSPEWCHILGDEDLYQYVT